MPGRSEATLNCSQHAGVVLQGLHQLRADSLLCDCILTLNNSQYHVHKCILAVSSPYFRTLFTSKGKWKESSKPEIVLNEINNTHFEAILQFIYTGVICLNMDNIAEIWAISDMFQMQQLQDICHDYLVNQISPSNCIGIWKHAWRFNDSELEQFTCQYIIANMGEISHHTEFLEMGSEDLLFLLSCYSKTQIDRENLKILMQQLKDTLSHEDSVLFHQQLTAHAEPHPCTNSANCSILSEGTCLLIAGGYDRGLISTWEKFCSDSQTWKKLNDLSPDQSKHYHWIGKVGVRIYAMTGNSPLSIDTSMESILSLKAAKQLRTEILDTGWEHESTMIHDFSNMSFCVLNDYIYGCGIFLQKSTHSSGSVGSPMNICQYSPSNGTWDVRTVETSAPRAMFQLEPHNGRLLFIGGLSADTEQVMSSFQAYHPETQFLEDLASMNHCRYDFGTATSGGYLYAVGGRSGNGCLLGSVERYGFETKTWCEWVSLPRPRACMACSTMGGALYCVGGEVYDNGRSNSTTRDTLVLELADKIWKSASPLNSPRSYLCVMKA